MHPASITTPVEHAALAEAAAYGDALPAEATVVARFRGGVLLSPGEGQLEAVLMPPIAAAEDAFWVWFQAHYSEPWFVTGHFLIGRYIEVIRLSVEPPP